MRDLSGRVRVLLATGTVAVLGSGVAGALMIPASAATPSSATRASTNDPLVQVCLTIREINYGPKCVAV